MLKNTSIEVASLPIALLNDSLTIESQLELSQRAAMAGDVGAISANWPRAGHPSAQLSANAAHHARGNVFANPDATATECAHLERFR